MFSISWHEKIVWKLSFLKMFPGDIWKAKPAEKISECNILACLLWFFKNYHSSASYNIFLKYQEDYLKKKCFFTSPVLNRA